MSRAYTPSRVINGTFGSVWLDGTPLPQGTKLEATVSLNKEEIKQTGTLAKGYKIAGSEGKGTLGMNKIDSTMIELLSDDMKNGKTTEHTLLSNLDDPDAFGNERIQFNGVIFDELKLADWEAGKMGEESIPFTFTSWDILEDIQPE